MTVSVSAELSSALLPLPFQSELSLFNAFQDLVKRARSKQLAPDEYNSGNFTISNMGMYGADTFDAILPPGARPPLTWCCPEHACL